MHAMRVRIMTAPAFTGDKVIAAILFERTMDGEAEGKPVPTFLWKTRGVVPFLKVDKGLEAEERRRQPDEADARSWTRCSTAPSSSASSAPRCAPTSTCASPTGIAAIVAQQFEVGIEIAKHGLVPILEPEVSIKSPDKPGAETLLRDQILAGLDALPRGPAGDAEADDPGHARPLRAADRAPQGGAGRRALRRLSREPSLRAPRRPITA